MIGNQVFCLVCGKPSEAGARFCMSCGAPIPLPTSTGGLQVPSMAAPMGVVSLNCNMCGTQLNIANDAQQVRCPACGSFFQIGRSGSAVYLQPEMPGVQNAQFFQTQMASYPIPEQPDRGKEIEITRQCVAELEKWNIFKSDVKIVKKWKGKEYAQGYSKQQFLRRLICLVVMIPGAVIYFSDPTSNTNTLIVLFSLIIFILSTLLVNSRGVKKEILKQQAYLDQLTQRN